MIKYILMSACFLVSFSFGALGMAYYLAHKMFERM